MYIDPRAIAAAHDYIIYRLNRGDKSLEYGDSANPRKNRPKREAIVDRKKSVKRRLFRGVVISTSATTAVDTWEKIMLKRWWKQGRLTDEGRLLMRVK